MLREKEEFVKKKRGVLKNCSTSLSPSPATYLQGGPACLDGALQRFLGLFRGMIRYCLVKAVPPYDFLEIRLLLETDRDLFRLKSAYQA